MFPFISKLVITDTEIIIKDLDKIFLDFQYPQLIVSKNETNFTLKKIRKHYKSNNIKFLTSSLYHPQSNGISENLIKKFKIFITKV